MKNSLIIFIALIFIACGQGKDKQYFANSSLEDFNSIINEKSESKTQQIISIEDENYYRGKLKLSLYSDETFQFEFADYSKESGQWIFENNAIQLEGNLGWIPLKMYVFRKSENSSEFYLQFTDAQGTKIRDLEQTESLETNK